MEEPSTPPNKTVPTTAQVATVFQRICAVAAGAESVISGVKGTAAFFMVEAIVLWILLFLPFGSIVLWKVIVAIGVGFLLLVPGIVWTLIAVGLLHVTKLPGRLLRHIDTSQQQLHAETTAIRSDAGIIKRTFRLLRSLAKIRDVGTEGKILFVETIALVRIFNPVTFVVSVVTFVSGLVILLMLVITAAVKGVI